MKILCLAFLLVLSVFTQAQTLDPSQVRGTAVVQTPDANQNTDLLNGTAYPGSAYASIQAAVNAAQAIHGSVVIPPLFAPGVMSAPGTNLTNSGIATGVYTNYLAPIVDDKRPFNHDSSFLQALSLPSLDGINEGGDMSGFAKCVQAGVCNITIVGNSIHACMSGIAPDESYCDPLFNAFKRKFPTVTFNFKNLSIGGTGVGNFNDVNYKCNVSFFRAPANSFYTDVPFYIAGGPYHQWPNGCTSGNSWQQEVAATNPNLVILGFVENTDATSQGAFIGAMLVAINTVHGFNPTGPATVVLTTDEPPNPNWCSLACPNPGQFEGLNEGIRGLALQTGSLLADADRYYNVFTYGIDPARRHYQFEFALPTYPAKWTPQAPFTGTMPTLANQGTQSVTLTFAAGNAAMVHEARTAVDPTIVITASSLSSAAVPAIAYRLDNAGNGNGYFAQASGGNTTGVWTIQLFYNRAVGNQILLQTGTCTTTPGSALTLTVKAVGSHHDVYCNSTLHPINVDDGNVNNGGEIAIGIQQGTGVLSRQYTEFGNPQMDFTPLVNIQTGLGQQAPPTPYDGNGDFITNIFSRGGDGLHHPSALGMDFYYLASFKPVMDQLALAIPQHSFQVEHRGFTGRYGGLQDSGNAENDFVNGPNGGRIVNNANNQVLEAWDNNLANPHLFFRPLQWNGGPAIASSGDICQSSGTGCPGGTQSANLAGSRTPGTTIHNTTGHPLMVQGYFTTTVGGPAGTACLDGAAAITETLTATNFATTIAGGQAGFSCVIPNGYFYQITGSGSVSTVTSWYETQL